MQRIEISKSMFEGSVSVEETEHGLKPWRCPYLRRELFPYVSAKMEDASGVRLRCKTNSRNITVNLAHPVSEGIEECYDLTIDGKIVSSSTRKSDHAESVELAIPSTDSNDDNIVELWLPQLCPVVIKSLHIDDGAQLSEINDDRIKWTTYGSSITHCVNAHSPARTWPAVAARKHNLNLTSLGYGGACHIEPMVAMMIRDIPADIISLKLGINVHGAGSLSPRTFICNVIGMIEIIREKHPETPIAVISPIICPPREDLKSNGLSLCDMRSELQDAVEKITRIDGDNNLFYVSGLELFGEDLLGPMLPDDLHPDGDGNVIMGERAAERVLGKLLSRS